MTIRPFLGGNGLRTRTSLSTSVAAIPISNYVPSLTRPVHGRRYATNSFRCPAVLIPGDSVLETTTIGGLATFFSIYQNVIVARILLSWFPGIQGNAIVRPIITVCDPYLNLFRNVVPPIFGLDLSPVVALLILQTFGSATTALGAELPATNPEENKSPHAISSRRKPKFLQRFM